MEFSESCSSHHVPVMVVLALMSLMMLLLPANGQTINNPCTPAMLTTFTPCFNFLTNSSANATSPSPACCNALKNLTSSSMGCTCLIVTGSVPFPLPINRTLAVSLPRACNMPSVPLQCNAPRGAPIPAPGPVSLAPKLSPGASPSLSPQSPIVPEPTPSAEVPDSGTTPSAEVPDSGTTPALTPPSSTAGSGAPTAATGSRPVLTPSAANPAYSFSPLLLVFTLGFLIFKY
ncbi:Non-specific lipid transfer protein-like 1 [Gossypium arboreum]|uniref:Non-specific lipid transfer protein-like 1 n=2 Tax=Gossypium arboreum TaxID=29729 RepID=A0A0B0NFW1_GOSAR|nr:non-specific lipid transfer protein GPI-anchored 20-like [Gossypium arboreum]KAK5804990.1 hypothetical protein PVK06_032642 [Gossypium arboreum]KHG09896.1 Non-specific lipid transfer protein-like 1 [Gossypium arboreum]